MGANYGLFPQATGLHPATSQSAGQRAESPMSPEATRIIQTRLHLDRPDVIIQPPLGRIRFLEFDRAEEIIAIGFEHTQRQLASLPPHVIQKLNPTA